MVLDLTKLREAAERATWHNGDDLPPVNRGSMQEFVLAVYRASAAKVYSFSASYLNAYPLEFRNGCPHEQCDGNRCEDGCPTSGWFLETGDDDYDSLFHEIELGEGDKVVGWRALPRWEDREGPATILALIERVERAEREIERLSEALEPFAREAAQWGNAVADDAMPVVLEIGHWDGRYYGSRAVYTIGDLRRARAALSQDKEGGT